MALSLFMWGLLFAIKQPVFISDELWTQSEILSDSSKLEQHVKVLSSYERFTDEWLNKASSYIIKSLEENWVDESIVTKQMYTVWDREYHNIIVKFSHVGKEPKIKKYVIWAHYDSHEELPWADDNASWVAWLLEIARIMNSQFMRNTELELVFYSTEEMPHFRDGTMWSYFHAKENPDVDLAIILEMIGYFSEEPWTQDFPIWALKYLYSDTWNYIALVSDFENFSSVRTLKKLMSQTILQKNIIWIESMNAPSSLVPDITRSDHKNYWKFWIPAIMITDTAYLRNKNYHTPEDTYEKLDYIKMKEVVDSVVYGVLNL